MFERTARRTAVGFPFSSFAFRGPIGGEGRPSGQGRGRAVVVRGGGAGSGSGGRPGRSAVGTRRSKSLPGHDEERTGRGLGTTALGRR